MLSRNLTTIFNRIRLESPSQIQNNVKLDGILPVVGNNSVINYKSGQNQVLSMISSLNNSGILLSNDKTSSKDKGSINIHHKPSNSVSNALPFKGKPFSGMNTAMINYAKDFDYLMMVDGSTKSGIKNTGESVHHYSVNNPASSKLGK
mmetsp:Transcript_1079/g.1057  ORF Transcript_1079/g.1057 Transcript_1079/m.1057 type:complete len:148 (+) Transcript_1079:307-750(+)